MLCVGCPDKVDYLVLSAHSPSQTGVQIQVVDGTEHIYTQKQHPERLHQRDSIVRIASFFDSIYYSGLCRTNLWYA